MNIINSNLKGKALNTKVFNLIQFLELTKIIEF